MLKVRAVLLGLVFVIASLVRAAAAPIPTDAFRAETLQTIGIKKARQLESEARRKIAIVLTGQSVQPTTTSNKSIDVLISGRPGSHLGVAVAAAIDRRGYFLTAAHVANDEPLSLVFYDGERLQALSARVVAKLSTSKREATTKLDIAVLHVEAELSEVFEWSDVAEVRRSDFLFQVGRVIHQQTATSGIVGPEVFVGKFQKAIKLRNGGTAIRTEMPARRGDSGGPVLTLDGKLLGIECGSVEPFWGREYELANRPDLEWLRDVMDKDNRLHHEVISTGQEVGTGEPLRITVPLLLE